MGRQSRKRTAEGWQCFWSMRRAAVALESVSYLFFIVGMVGGVFELVNTFFVGDLLDRAAHAVARDNSLRGQAADTEEALLQRSREAIRAEVGHRLNPELLTIDVDIYDDPSTMLQGELTTGANGLLGGDAGDMVVVRLRLRPQTPLLWMRQELLPDDFAFHALAVARNERMVGLPQTPESEDVP